MDFLRMPRLDPGAPPDRCVYCDALLLDDEPRVEIRCDGKRPTRYEHFLGVVCQRCGDARRRMKRIAEVDATLAKFERNFMEGDGA